MKPIRRDHLRVKQVGTGAPVVLTHGLGDTSATWDRLVPALAVEHRVITWDLRGHGLSEAPATPGDYSRDLAIQDLLEVMGEAGEPVSLIGHSLGGYLSLAVALAHPQLVDALVMIASGPGFRDAAARQQWNAYVANAVVEMPVPAAAAGLCQQPDSWVIGALGTLGRPLLHIVGDKDRRFHAGPTYIQRTLPSSIALSIPGAGHHPQLTHHDEVLGALFGFLPTDRS